MLLLGVCCLVCVLFVVDRCPLVVVCLCQSFVGCCRRVSFVVC